MNQPVSQSFAKIVLNECMLSLSLNLQRAIIEDC